MRIKIKNEPKRQAVPVDAATKLNKLAREGEKLTADAIAAALTFKALKFQANSKILNIKINPTFEALIPALSAEEYNLLERNVIAEGCRDSLLVWQERNTLIDGHNRFKICTKYYIPFETIQKSFESEDDAKSWIVLHHLGRRSLNKFQKCEIALKLEPDIAKKANENQGKRTDLLQNSAEGSSEFAPTSTRDELEKITGASHDTISKVKKILDSGIQKLIEEVRIGTTSINAAYKVTLMPSERQSAVLNEIDAGKSVKEAISSTGASRGKRKKSKVEVSQQEQSLPDEINSKANEIAPPDKQNDSGSEANGSNDKANDNPEIATTAPSSDGTREEQKEYPPVAFDGDSVIIKKDYYTFNEINDPNGNPIKFECCHLKDGRRILICKPEHKDEFQALLARLRFKLCNKP